MRTLIKSENQNHNMNIDYEETLKLYRLALNKITQSYFVKRVWKKNDSMTYAMNKVHVYNITE